MSPPFGQEFSASFPAALLLFAASPTFASINQVRAP